MAGILPDLDAYRAAMQPALAPSNVPLFASQAPQQAQASMSPSDLIVMGLRALGVGPNANLPSMANDFARSMGWDFLFPGMRHDLSKRPQGQINQRWPAPNEMFTPMAQPQEQQSQLGQPQFQLLAGQR